MPRTPSIVEENSTYLPSLDQTAGEGVESVDNRVSDWRVRSKTRRPSSTRYTDANNPSLESATPLWSRTGLTVDSRFPVRSIQTSSYPAGFRSLPYTRVPPP